MAKSFGCRSRRRAAHGRRSTAAAGKIKAYIKAAGIEKSGACHLFRHTMATLMLENGADIRFIQEMLGHASLETTTIYTQVSIRALKEVYARTHPAKHLPHSAQARESDNDEVTEVNVFAELDAEAARDREDCKRGEANLIAAL